MPVSPSKVIPWLYSSDIDRTVQFYLTSLSFAGFKLGGRYNHSPEVDDKDTFASIATGDKSCVNFYFRTDLESGPAKVMVMLDTLEEIDALWGALGEKAGGVRVTQEVGDKPWGYRQFEIADPDDNRLLFFAFLSDEE